MVQVGAVEATSALHGKICNIPTGSCKNPYLIATECNFSKPACHDYTVMCQYTSVRISMASNANTFSSDAVVVQFYTHSRRAHIMALV